MRVCGITAMITGAASGLGSATARRFHDQGASVVLVNLDEEMGMAIGHELGERAVFVHADITVSAELKNATDAAVRKFGALSVLVNSGASGSIVAKTVSKAGAFDIDEFRRVIAVNLVGTFDAARLAAVKMTHNEPNEWGERGVIINTASTAAFEAPAGQVAYAASKAGVAGMTIVMARDLGGYGIRVCTIAPGIFDIPGAVGGLSAEVRAMVSQNPFPRRLGRPDEYAMLAQHIIENPMLNGETFRLDGALRLPSK